MSLRELQVRTSELVYQISEIKNERITSNIFTKFLEHLRSEAALLLELTDNHEIKAQLAELSNFREFDDLSLVERILIKLFVYRFHANWAGDWTSVGKYWNDLYSIELRLKGILYKLKNNSQ